MALKVKSESWSRNY